MPNCEVGKEGPPRPAIQGYIGHSYRLDCDISGNKVITIGSLYWGKHYAYAVMVMFPANVPEPAAVKKFMDSFSVGSASE